MSAAHVMGGAAATPEGGPPLRVLIVEDSAPVAESLLLALEACGVSARAVHTGRDGLEEARRFRPDIVLMDLGLPDMDGHEAARLIAQSGLAPQPVLIALSGRRGVADAPFAHTLLKPVRLEALLSALQPHEGRTCARQS